VIFRGATSSLVNFGGRDVSEYVIAFGFAGKVTVFVNPIQELGQPSPSLGQELRRDSNIATTKHRSGEDRRIGHRFGMKIFHFANHLAGCCSKRVKRLLPVFRGGLSQLVAKSCHCPSVKVLGSRSLLLRSDRAQKADFEQRLGVVMDNLGRFAQLTSDLGGCATFIRSVAPEDLMPFDRAQTLELIEAERDGFELVGEKTQDLEKTEEGFVSPLPPIGVHAKSSD